MNKNESDVIKKIKEIMVSYQSSAALNFYDFDAGKNDFSLVEKSDTRYITLINQPDSTPNSKRLTNEEAFDLVDDYLKNGGKPLQIKIKGKVRYNGLITALMKNQPTGEFLNMVLDSFFIIKDNSIFENALSKINQSIKSKTCDPSYGHELAFKTISRVGSAGPISKSEVYFYSSFFPSICNLLSKFKIKEEDYPVLHKIFNYFEMPIEMDINARQAFFSFLKTSIPSKDWSIFKAHLKDESQHKCKSKIGDMFEEKSNPKYHLNISEQFVTNKYPSISLSTDYLDMMTSLVALMKNFKNELGLEQCNMISHNNKVTELYFLSKDENIVDEGKIKTILSSMIDFYAEMKEQRKNVNKESLALTMRANLLVIELEKPSDKAENKNFRKTTKI